MYPATRPQSYTLFPDMEVDEVPVGSITWGMGSKGKVFIIRKGAHRITFYRRRLTPDNPYPIWGEEYFRTKSRGLLMKTFRPYTTPTKWFPEGALLALKAWALTGTF